ncbi:MAG: ABC transporter ATP-binding protein [Spirochaetes bacterium]|nr:ABC transporter ATP-binding protein [Spirochaetota bacterium]
MLELNNISYIKNGDYLLKNINISVNPGEIISIIGKEASGKTLLLKIISSVIRSTEGTFRYNGNLISSLTKKNLLRVFSHSIRPGFNHGRTVYNTVLHSRLYLKNFFRPLNQEDISEIDKQISNFNLTHLKYKKYGSLTKGEKKRTELAYLFARGADIILMENPEQNLDLNSLHILSRAIHKYVIDGGKMIIMENSSVNAALENSDRIVSIKNGTVLMDKRTEDYTEEDFKNIFNTDLYLSKNMITGRNIVTAANTI